MLRSILFLTTLFVFTFSRLEACSCAYVATFCETIGYSDTLYHDLIIYGTVTDITHQGMEVAVAERLHGTDDRSFIFVRSGNGADCGENASRFVVGQQLILALLRRYVPNQPEVKEYWLSICGVNWLLVEDGHVKGPIAPGEVYLSYKNFKKSSTCRAFEQFQPTGPGDLELKVYPNPVKERLFIEISEAVESFDYIISDICGKIVLRGIREEVEAESQITIELPLEQLSSGLYFLKIMSGMEEKTVKLMIVAD